MIKKVLNDIVVFEMPDFTKECKTGAGIILPDGKSDKNVIVEVLEVGSGIRDRSGSLIPIDLQKGDKILVPFGRGYPVKLDDGKTYIFIKYDDILAKVEN